MPGPATVLVNFSIDTSTCFLRRQACEYFIFAQFVSGGFWARDMSFGQLMVQSVLKFFFELSNSSWLPLCHHHSHLSLLLPSDHPLLSEPTTCGPLISTKLG